MTHSLSKACRRLLEPDRLYAVSEIADCPSLVPKSPGLYGWWFEGLSGRVPVEGAPLRDGRRLLYIGIAPSRPSSSRTLQDRLKNHSRGPIGSSTLRRTLVCILAAELGLEVSRRGKKLVMTNDHEARLTAWLDAKARIGWAAAPKPWSIEGAVIRRLCPPLNIDGSCHPFASVLKKLRASICPR